MWSEDGVVWGVVLGWKILFGHKFYPVRELHTPTTALAENAILMGSTEYHRVKDFRSGCVKDLFHHLKLCVAQGLGWQFRAVSTIVDLCVWDPRIEGGILSLLHPKSLTTLESLLLIFRLECIALLAVHGL